jgi:hypothetical protein
MLSRTMTLSAIGIQSALMAKFKEDIDGRQHSLNLRKHGGYFVSAAGSQPLCLLIVSFRQRALQIERDRNFALDPLQISAGAVLICSELSVIPIIVLSPSTLDLYDAGILPGQC